MSASAAISAVGTAFGHIFGAVQVHTTRTALTGTAVDLDVVNEISGHYSFLLLFFLSATNAGNRRSSCAKVQSGFTLLLTMKYS